MRPSPLRAAQPGDAMGPLTFAGQAKAIMQRIDGLEDRFHLLTEAFSGFTSAALVRENAYFVVEVDTNAATRSNPSVHDLAYRFNGPANSLRVLGAGGGALEGSLNGGDWFALAAGDVVEHFSIERLAIRSTTPAAGTARIWVAGRARRT